MMADTRLTPALLLLVALASCDYLPFGYTKISDILAAPTTFEGKRVKLRGTVKDITKVPILELKSFTLQDDTGEISVISPASLPAVNDRVVLEGTVKSMAIIGGQALGLRVEEIRRSGSRE